MATKKVSKGNIFNCIENAQRNKKLRKEIQSFMETRGKGYTDKTFMERFHELGYENVSLKDARTLLNNVKTLKDTDQMPWKY